MSDLKALLERADRAVSDVPLPADGLEGLQRRRDSKRRNQRIAAGVVGIAVFVAAVWIVTSVGSLDHSETPAVPGSAETGPAVSNCVVTRCTETGPVPPSPPPAGIIAPPTTGYLIDLNTGEITQLPKSMKSIAGFGYAVSPDGTMVAYISEDDAGTPQVFIASLDGTDVQQVTHDQRGASAPAWSPDGEAIAYASGDYTLVDEDVVNIFVLDLATGETSQVTNEKPTTETNLSVGLGLGAAFPQFSPDGASIIYTVNRGDGFSMRIVPVRGGKSVLLVGGGKNDVEAVLGTLSPDGSTLAASCLGRLEGICIAHADGTNLRVLVNGPSLVGPNWSPDGTRIAYTNANANPYTVFVVDVATGETTFVAEGTVSEWLDDHTLIVEHVSLG
jgi:dipeptidyl aminopeptidase/acylaminoacyl peptidase